MRSVMHKSFHGQGKVKNYAFPKAHAEVLVICYWKFWKVMCSINPALEGKK